MAEKKSISSPLLTSAYFDDLALRPDERKDVRLTEVNTSGGSPLATGSGGIFTPVNFAGYEQNIEGGAHGDIMILQRPVIPVAPLNTSSTSVRKPKVIPSSAVGGGLPADIANVGSITRITNARFTLTVPAGVPTTEYFAFGGANIASTVATGVAHCVISRLVLVIHSWSSPTSSTLTLTVLKNGAPTSLTLVIVAGLPGTYEVTSAVEFADGNLFLLSVMGEKTSGPPSSIVFSGAIKARAV